MPVNVETPPPRIGKIGPYTVFVTPPSTSSTPTNPSPRPVSDSPKKAVPASPLTSPPVQLPVQSNPIPPPLVQAPPSQFNTHASLDEHVAYWFGLNQSKYQWALDDYCESQGTKSMDATSKGLSDKVQNV